MSRLRYGPLLRAFLGIASAFIALFLTVGSLSAVAQPIPAASEGPAPVGSADALDRQTPRRTLEGFLKEGREGDFPVAASYLDLRDVAPAERDKRGPDLARKLAYVLEREPTLAVSKIPDAPEAGSNSRPPGTWVADILYAGEQPVPIALTRVRFADGVDRWLIARSTVSAIPALDAAYGPRPVGIRIPASLKRTTLLGNEPWQWLGIAAAAIFAYGIGRGLAAAVVRAASYFAHRTSTRADDVLVESARRPLRTLVAALIFRLLLGPLQLTTDVVAVCEHATYTALVVGLAWLVLRSLGAATLWLDEQAGAHEDDLLRGRRVRTQALLLRRVASLIIGLVAAAVVLLQFEFVRSVGVSLLASAGVVSVVVGLAAQKSLAAIIAGVQFSVAQPARIGDQVVIEGEFGEVEEIYLTFAVVRIWDKRRLILPITYFLERPFQNWTRSATDLVGAVVFKLDFGAPVDALRTELARICETETLWDKRMCILQVTDSDESAITLRALVSSQDAGKLWDLRCNVRERLLAFVQSHDNGRHLPRHRIRAESP